MQSTHKREVLSDDPNDTETTKMITCKSPFLAAVLLSAGAICTAMSAIAAENVTIVHFNDLDRMSEDDGRGGVARLAAVIENERANGGHVLVTFGGDTISPSLMSGFDEGAHMIEFLNALGLTAMAIGNHEYDFGPDVARQRIAEANFPVLGANNIEPGGSVIAGASPSIMVDIGPFKIGILGLTTVGTLVKSSPGDVMIENAADTAASEASKLREEGANLVIALAHTDIAEDRELLERRDVDIILSGDDHVLRTEYDGEILFAESGEQAEWVTAVDLVLDEVKDDDKMEFVWSAEYRIIDTLHVMPNEALAAKVDEFNALLDKELDIELGVTLTELDTRRSTIRGKEAAFGNLAADAIREATGADLALVNGGGVRADRIYDPGTVLTRRDIVSELPFGNSTVVLRITGQDFIDVLENGYSQIEKGAGRFPHISGAMVRYDPSREPGSRVLEVLVNGEPIDTAKMFDFAVNDYVAGGGDGYANLADKPRIVDENAAILMTTQLFDYIQSRGEVSPMADGRMVAVQ